MENPVGREKALAILTWFGREDEYDPQADYYIRGDGINREELWAWGEDEPLATNPRHMSWTSPGFPRVSGTAWDSHRGPCR